MSALTPRGAVAPDETRDWRRCAALVPRCPRARSTAAKVLARARCVLASVFYIVVAQSYLLALPAGAAESMPATVPTPPPARPTSLPEARASSLAVQPRAEVLAGGGTANEAFPRGFTLALHWAAGTSAGSAGATSPTTSGGATFTPTIGVAAGLELGRVHLKALLFVRYFQSHAMLLTPPTPSPGTSSTLTFGVTPLLEVTIIRLDNARGFLLAGPHLGLALHEPGEDDESVGLSFGAILGVGLRARIHPRLGLGVTAGLLWSMATFRSAMSSNAGSGIGVFGMLDLTAFFGRIAHPRP